MPSDEMLRFGARIGVTTHAIERFKERSAVPLNAAGAAERAIVKSVRNSRPLLATDFRADLLSKQDGCHYRINDHHNIIFALEAKPDGFAVITCLTADPEAGLTKKYGKHFVLWWREQRNKTTIPQKIAIELAHAAWKAGFDHARGAQSE